MPGDCVSIPPARLCVGGPYLQREFVLLGRYVFILILTKKKRYQTPFGLEFPDPPTFDFRLSTFEFRHPTSDFRLPTSDLSTSNFQLPTSDLRLSTSDFRLKTFDLRLTPHLTIGISLIFLNLNIPECNTGSPVLQTDMAAQVLSKIGVRFKMRFFNFVGPCF